MARGRKPIQRTKEEAKVVRREQIRRNVQAFRQRKNACRENDTSSKTRVNELTFVQDGRGGDGQDAQLCDIGFARQKTNDVPETLDLKTNVEPEQSSSRSLDVSETPDIEIIKSSGQVGVTYAELLPPTVSAAVVIRQQFVSNSAQIFLPLGLTLTGQDKDTGLHWAQTLPYMINRDSILDTSIQALCLLQIAHVNRETWLSEASRFYYGQALQELSAAISHPRGPKALRNEVFATAMTLSTYELFNGTPENQGVGCKYHLQGASSYLARFYSPNNVFSDQLIFHFLETICVFDALRSRKASPFVQTRWWDVNLERFGGETYGPLLRLMALIPQFMEEGDRITSSSPGTASFETAITLLEHVQSLEDRLNSWFDHTVATLPRFANHELTSTAVTESSLEPIKIRFPNLFIARLYLLYWSSIIALQGVTSMVTGSLHRHTEDVDESILLPSLALNSSLLFKKLNDQAQDSAQRVLRSVDFCLQPAYGILGRSVMLLPLWFAEVHFDAYSPGEAQQCREKLRTLGQVPWQSRTRGWSNRHSEQSPAWSKRACSEQWTYSELLEILSSTNIFLYRRWVTIGVRSITPEILMGMFAPLFYGMLIIKLSTQADWQGMITL